MSLPPMKMWPFQIDAIAEMRGTMTEQQWLACENPLLLLQHVEGKATRRNLRMFVEACRLDSSRSDRAWGNYDLDMPNSLKVACECWANCFQSIMETNPLPKRSAILRDIVGNPFQPVVREYDYCNSVKGRNAVEARIAAARASVKFEAFVAEEAFYSQELKKCLFLEEWQTHAVLGLARSIHEDRAFDLMPILGDALKEAGCDNQQILAHCTAVETAEHNAEGLCGSAFRGCAPDCPKDQWERYGTPLHVRGCWVIDLILGLE